MGWALGGLGFRSSGASVLCLRLRGLGLPFLALGVGARVEFDGSSESE